jgi:hypothetical protein
MESGKVETVSSSPGYIQQKFIPEYELQKGFTTKVKDFFTQLSMGVPEENVSLKNDNTAFYCDHCKKVLAEYEVY